MTSPHHTEGPTPTRIGRLDDLPLQLTSFVGRERELEEIEDLLGETRLLMLTGPGGCGKTRLAMMAAERVADGFEGGVGWVWLAPVSDQTLVPRTVASALGAREAPGLSPTEALVERIGDSEVLLVLDNCEHLIEACAALVDGILRSCPGLKVLGTSREPLNIAGETAWSVPPLSRPAPDDAFDPGELARYEAVRLFVERAWVAAPGFQLTAENAAAVARVCERLDGLPLAIELAAARVRVLSVEQISHRLDNALGLLTEGGRMAPFHQRTLRGALDWSHDLLPEEEQVLFRRLSVFGDGFELGMAEGICSGSGLDGGDVLPLLSRLVDKSLVLVTDREGEARYRLLATVRQYAEEKLRLSGEEPETRRRHARFYLELAEQAGPEFTGPNQEEWLDRLEGELGNLRAAMRWSLGSGGPGDAEVGLRTAGALWRFCYLRGYYGEGRGWLERALALDEPVRSSPHARALTGAGVLALLQCDYEPAEERLEESLALYRELNDGRGEASVLQVLGSVARERGYYERAKAYHEESLALWRVLGDDGEIARSLNYLGFAAWLQEDFDQAVELCTQTLGMFRRPGDAEGVAWALISLGSAALYGGDRARAEALLEESLATSRHAGYREGIAWSLNQLGVAAYRGEEPGRAETLLRESLKVHRNLGDRWRIASVLEGLAEVACSRGLTERATRLFGAAEALREAISTPIPPCERDDRDRGVSAARAGLGEETFARARARGRALTLEEAIAQASEVSHPPEVPAPLTHDLSAREVEVLGLVAEGLTDAQVAERLFLSPRTVGHHLRSVYRKLEVPSRAAAAKTALERGLI